MQTFVVATFALITLTAVVSLGVFYWQFQSWPPRLWALRLARRIEELAHRRDDLLDAGDSRSGVSATRRLFDDLFHRHLQSVPVGALERFPGIGPGTVDRIRTAGGRTLDDLTNFRFEHIPGIGPAKGHDLRTAVTSLVKEARSRFEAGACPEAQEYRRQLATMKAEDRDAAGVRDREVAAIDDALAEARDPLEVARDVTFWNYLFHREVPGLTDEMMERPLPTAKEVKPAPTVPVAPAVARPPEVRIPVGTPAVARPAVAKPAAPALAVDLFQTALQTRPSAEREEHPWLPKLRAYVRLGFLIAKADGRIAQAEKKVLRQFLGDKFGHDGVLLRQIDPLMETAEKAAVDETAVLEDVKRVTTAVEQRELFGLADRIVDASGERNERERKMIDRIAAAFEIKTPLCVEKYSFSREAESSEPSTREKKAKPSNGSGDSLRSEDSASRLNGSGSSPEPRSILEIEPATELSVELIRRRYTLLSEKLDPARAAALGPEFAAMAERKRAELRRAAESLIAPFNAPLEAPAAPPPPADLRHNPDLDDVFGG